MANYCGIPGVEFIYHGDWADPELIYKDHVFNVYDAEDFLWDEFQERTNNTGACEEFVQWLHDNPYLVTNYLDDLIALSETETAC